MPLQTYRKITDLPKTFPVFPLTGALLFPRWTLPLNIFEPRYLNMIDDAMSGHRLIGMIQNEGNDATHPTLMEVGCAGRITSYSETDDGRYLIVLTGVARFRVEQERDLKTPYRQIDADWTPFIHDLAPPVVTDLPKRETLIGALRAYVTRNDMKADWSAVEDAPIETLVNALCAGCPFTPPEKQALIEAASLRDRCETLIALLDMDMPGDDEGTIQ
ncbi:MAG: LON peptidase substrate-binding domain-containing protein [Pseudomonadota bacterium]